MPAKIEMINDIEAAIGVSFTEASSNTKGLT